MSKKRYIAAIVTEEKGTLYLTSWNSGESFLTKDKTIAFGYCDTDLAKVSCKTAKKHAEKQGLTVVSTAVLEAHEPDAVHSPAHYQLADGVEAIDVIDEAVEDPASFYRGNAIKYLLRAGRKGDAKQDLEKARWYIDRELNNA